MHLPSSVVARLGRRILVAGLLFGLGTESASRAVIVRGDDENPVPPTVPGAVEAAAWVGELRDPGTPGTLGTPIGPRHFLTAAHIEFVAGDPFWFRGVRYTVVHRVALPDSDLAVGEVDAEFPFHLGLYPRDDESRRPLLLLGKGRWKGDPVLSAGVLRGWRYADSGTPGIRWGTNMVEGVVRSDPDGEGLQGDFLVADFDGEGGADEVHLTRGDSGAPVLVQDCGEWKIAGVASAVDGPFVPADAVASEPFLAALFDARGFKIAEGDESFTPVDDLGVPSPTAWYAARVSSRLEELRALVGLPAGGGADPRTDLFVWAEPEITIPIEVMRSSVAPEAGGVRVECSDAISAAGGRVTWTEGLARYVAPAAEGAGGGRVEVDSFRYVVGNPGLRGNSGGRAFVLSRDLARGAPRVAVGPEDITVVVWPVAAPAGAAGSAPRVERARSAAGPWESVPTAVVQLEDWYLFAARPERGFDRAGFFRLVFESPP